MVALTLYLGHWQQGRAAEKQALQTEFDSRSGAAPVSLTKEIGDPVALRYSHASAQGEWLATGQIFIDNKFDNDAVGFHVITPLKIAGTNRFILVNRGWIARDAKYPAAPEVAVPAGTATIEGLLVVPSTRFLELAPVMLEGSVWQNLTVERYRQKSGLDVLPLVLLASNAGSGLKPVSERPDTRADKHVEYMLTWYSLAASVVALWVILNLKFERISPRLPTVSNRIDQ
jgi:surfeit locus 1 family protein